MREKGFLAISLVLVIATAILAITISVTYSAIGEGQSGLALTSGEQSLHLTESCVEDVLSKIRANASYNGGTITLPEGNCTVTMGSGTFTVSSTLARYTRSIQVQYTRSNKITVNSWKEV